jgi:methylmalonyl-CoA/ethylmalonyl-CoA epimerase
MFNKIRAIHIAVKNLEEAAKLYTDSYGLQVSKSDTLPVLGIKNAILPIGDAVIELIEPLDPQQGPVAKFLQSRGEGVYMIALEVDDIDSAIQSLQDKDVRLLSADDESRAKGIPVFIHPQSTKGLLIELVQKASA